MVGLENGPTGVGLRSARIRESAQGSTPGTSPLRSSPAWQQGRSGLPRIRVSLHACLPAGVSGLDAPELLQDVERPSVLPLVPGTCGRDFSHVEVTMGIGPGGVGRQETPRRPWIRAGDLGEDSPFQVAEGDHAL